MRYKLDKKNPYDKKKFSLKRSIQSAVSMLLIGGLLITVTGRIGNMIHIYQAEKMYTEAIAYYEDVLESTATFFKENDVKTPDECFSLYCKLLWNGYFSNGRYYQYNVGDYHNIAGYYGIKIATGEGDCKNNEDFFCQLMNKLGYQAYQIVCIGGNASHTISGNIFGNHVITIVSYNGKNYYYDTTNMCSYQKKNMYECVNTNKDLSVTLKPITSYAYGYNEILDIGELFLDQYFFDSGDDFIVDKNLSEMISCSKILQLRKKIEPSLEKICELISEG